MRFLVLILALGTMASARDGSGGAVLAMVGMLFLLMRQERPRG